VNLAIVLASLFLILGTIRKMAGNKSIILQLFLWYLCSVIIFIISSELDHITVLHYYSSLASIPEIIKQNSKIGYPIIWGASSLAIMAIGFRKKNKMLRIISLSIFGITILKLFLFDIREVSAGGKTAAFLILGVILLLVSFLYQKLKKLIFDDNTDHDIK
jgi:uncharacterized membrane protein